MATLMDKAKTALRLSTDYYDGEIAGYIKAAKMDLALVGIKNIEPGSVVTDNLISTAIITYVRLHFGDLQDAEYDRLKASYDEQKAQLMTATGYTDWGGGA